MASTKKNIVVLLLDTVRAEDVYGNSSLTTLNYVARNSTTYGCAVAPGTWTPPAHAALFTNKKVSLLKNVSQDFLNDGTRKIDPWLVKTKFLDEHENTIAKKLSNQGYQSVLLSNNPFVTSKTNLAVGFDEIYDLWLSSNVKYNKGFAKHFNFLLNGGASAREKMMDTAYMMTRLLPEPIMDSLYLRLRKAMHSKSSQVSGTHMLDRGSRDTTATLKKHFDYKYNYKPQFLFVNYMEAHEHYPTYDKEMTQDKWMYLSGLEEMAEYRMQSLHKGYLKRLKYLDKSIGSTIEVLKKSGTLDDATLIITSDHGQFFGEHGLLYHSLPPYEQVSRVPLIVGNYKNGKLLKFKETIEKPISTASIHNAILNLASGRFDYLNGNLQKDKYVACEHTGIAEGWDEKLLRMLAPRAKSAAMILKAKRKHNVRVTAIYKDNLKLMHYFGKKTDEMYDVEKDPAEATDIIGHNRQLALEMANMCYN
jgi:arylsulfatase A-like enzyme